MKKVNNWLFGKAGKVLKAIAVWAFWLEVIGALIGAIYAFIDDIEFLYSLLAIPGAWLASLFIYGIGEAIDNSAAIRAKVCGDIEYTANKSESPKYDAIKNTIKTPAAPVSHAVSYSSLMDIVNTALSFKSDEGALNYVADKLDRMSAEDRLKFEPMIPYITKKKSDDFKEALAKFAENL